MRKCDLCGERVVGKYSHHKTRDDNGRIKMLNGHYDCIKQYAFEEEYEGAIWLPWVLRPICRELSIHFIDYGGNRPPKPNIQFEESECTDDGTGRCCRELPERWKELLKEYDGKYKW